VLEGAVDVRLAATGEHRHANSGQTMLYEPARVLAEPAAADLATVSAWREGKLVFRGKALGEALEEFGRYHDFTFRIADRELARWPISGVFATRELGAFLRGLEAVLPVTVEHGPQGRVSIARRKPA
jgi:transmembrane sensor